MSRSAFFASAPTERFLRAMERLRQLPALQRRKIAAAVHAEIAPLVANPDVDALRRAARAAQDERWRLISAGTRDMTDARFASVVVAEQWLLARLEIVGSAAAVSEALAQNRRNAIEDFIRANLPAGEVVQLYPHAAPARPERSGSSKPAA
jgi:heme oxygenase